MNETPSIIKKEVPQIVPEKNPAQKIETPEATSEEIKSLQEAILSEQAKLEAVQGEKGEESFLSQETKRKLKKAVLVLSLFAASFAATLGEAEARDNHNNQTRHAQDPYKRAMEQGVTQSIRNVFNNTQRNILYADREQQRMERERTNLYRQAFQEYNHDLHDARNSPSALNDAKQKYDERVRTIDELISSGRY